MYVTMYTIIYYKFKYCNNKKTSLVKNIQWITNHSPRQEKSWRLNGREETKNEEKKNSDIWIVYDCENKNNRVDFQVPVIDLILVWYVKHNCYG